MPRKWLVLALCALGMGLAACSKLESQKIAKEGGKMPLTEYKDSTVLDMHDGSRLAWRLRTLHLVRWPDNELVHATPVDLSVFDSLGRPLMRVTADSGAVDEAVNFLLAQGHVHGVSSKGMELRTDSLRWSKTLNQVTTEAAVRVVSENGDILTGRGFVSDANLDHWQILSDVKGVFQDAGDRTGELGGIGADARAADSNASKASPGKATAP
jgi:LPS export ABC transporter protein LptC